MCQRTVRKFETSVKITADTEIVVSFVQVFTVTVIYDSEKGAVTTEPEHVGDVVTVEDGAEVTLTADPEDNYRVAKVVINEKDEEVAEVNYESGQVYEKTLKADQNYTIKITFAPNRYEITLQETENGTVTTDPSGMVDHGSAYDVTVTPDEEYSVASVTVNGEEITEDFQTDESGKVTFTVSDVAGPQQIEAVFTETEIRKTEVTELFNGNEAVRVTEEDQTYVFARDAKVDFSVNTISTLERPVSGIRLLDAEGNVIGGGKDLASVTISADQAAAPLPIAKIQLWYQADGEMTAMWHDVSDVSAEQPLVIVIDQTAPEIELLPEEKDSGNYYTNSFSVAVSLKSEDASGVDRIEYFVTDAKMDPDTQYDEVLREEKTQTGETAVGSSILVEVNEEQNNSDDVCVWVKATDYAGNQTVTKTENLFVNYLSVEITLDGTEADYQEKMDEDGYVRGYFRLEKRTATITVTDRKFDQEAATEGIKVSAKDNEKEFAAEEVCKITWNEVTENIHQATIEFFVQANYTWSFAGYKNQAGIQVGGDAFNIVKEGTLTPYYFTLDTTPPTGTVKVNDNIWDKILEIITFGLYSRDSAEITAAAEDVTSPVEVAYYKLQIRRR